MSATSPTISVHRAAAMLGIAPSSAYAAIRNNNFPTPVIQIGGRYVVPTKPFLALLGLDELPTDGAPAVA
ncbi:helix-turn-helix transcriptional regulator [Corynebacterium flavescens]|uniref:helix-turn-helix transcriptional regulator n=1 Tax=Corynebacterium flavescens TaxID=28028 RepID=UPI003FD3AD31